MKKQSIIIIHMIDLEIKRKRRNEIYEVSEVFY